MDAAETALRAQLVATLRGGEAFETYDEIVAAVPAAQRGVVPPGAERSAWQIVEHIRIAQRDILRFAVNASRDGGGAPGSGYQAMAWPDDYWPIDPAPARPGDWNASALGYDADREELERLALDPATDLLATLPWADDPAQTVLRELLLAAEHTAHHLGELIVLRRWLASQPPPPPPPAP